MDKKHPINPEWNQYYEELERIRESGDTNMWGAAPYLGKACKISYDLAAEVLLSWISNYSELAKQFNWR